MAQQPAAAAGSNKPKLSTSDEILIFPVENNEALGLLPKYYQKFLPHFK
jgi:hypothetical protein